MQFHGDAAAIMPKRTRGDLGEGRGESDLVVVPQSVIEAQTIPIKAHTRDPTADEIVDVSDVLREGTLMSVMRCVKGRQVHTKECCRAPMDLSRSCPKASQGALVGQQCPPA